MKSNQTLLLVFLLIFIGCSDQSIVESNEATPSDIAIMSGSSQTHGSTAKLLASGSVVEVPAGSVDALADAIASAGSGGVVLLKSGEHHESGTVEVNHTVSIVGESGATLYVDTQPTTQAGKINPGLYVRNASYVLIRGLEILPKGDTGGTAVYTENAPYALLEQNTIRDHEFGIVIQQGDRTKIRANTIVGSSGWLTGDLPVVDGIDIINGDFVEISDNTVSNTVFGIFATDRKGLLTDNETYGNFIGVILCNIPNEIIEPGGSVIGSEQSGTKWIVRTNHSHDNFDIGFLVVDGANENLLVNNRGGNNGRYDIELAGDTERFGFFTPTSFKNKVNAGFVTDITVKDCGLDSEVNGGIPIDTSSDPCS